MTKPVPAQYLLLDELGLLDAYREQPGTFEDLARQAFITAMRAARSTQGAGAQVLPRRDDCRDVLASILPYTKAWRALCLKKLPFHPWHYVEDATKLFADYLIDEYWLTLISDLG